MSCGGSVSWFSRNEKFTSLSSSDAEYINITEYATKVPSSRRIMSFVAWGGRLGRDYEDNDGV